MLSPNSPLNSSPSRWKTSASSFPSRISKPPLALFRRSSLLVSIRSPLNSWSATSSTLLADYTGNKIIPTNVDGHEVGAYILVTLDGNDQDEIFQRAETLAEIGDELGAFNTLVLSHPDDKRAVWAARSAFLTVIEADTEHLDEMDVVVPVDKVAEFLEHVDRDLAKSTALAFAPSVMPVTATFIFTLLQTA